MINPGRLFREISFLSLKKKHSHIHTPNPTLCIFPTFLHDKAIFFFNNINKVEKPDSSLRSQVPRLKIAEVCVMRNLLGIPKWMVDVIDHYFHLTLSLLLYEIQIAEFR